MWLYLTTCSENRAAKRPGWKKGNDRAQKVKCLRLRAHVAPELPTCTASTLLLWQGCAEPTHIAEGIVAHAQISLWHLMCCGRRHLAGHEHILHTFFLLCMTAALHIQQTSIHLQRRCLMHSSCQTFLKNSTLLRKAYCIPYNICIQQILRPCHAFSIISTLG